MARKLKMLPNRSYINDVYALDSQTPTYAIVPTGKNIHISLQSGEELGLISYRHSSRGVPTTLGILDVDLLEIVRDHLYILQQGRESCRENSNALTCIEEAIMWINRRNTP